nr:MAG TPA: hypothetical protein [Caudoviricetes sp.]
MRILYLKLKPVPSFRFGLFYFLLQQNYNNPAIVFFRSA